MGNLIALHSLITFTLLCLARTNPVEDFHCCLNRIARPSLKNKVLSRNSSRYSYLLNDGEKISRWLNSSTSESPILVVEPADENEVQAFILCSKKLDLPVRIRSGGHDYEGLSYRSTTKTPFIMIDLHNMRDVKIDVKSETAWVQTGATLGQLYYNIAQKSKVHAFPGGLYSTVGTGGIISGGGLGTLMRKYGLSADNVIDARVIDANGRILDRKEMGEDLFWAIRGGGGASFGIILEWKLKLVRVPELTTAFTLRRKLDSKSVQLIQRWERIGSKFPEDLFTRILIHNPGPVFPGGETIIQLALQGLFLGTADKFVPLLNQHFPEFKLKIRDCFRDPVAKKGCKKKPCIKKECYQLPWIKSVLYHEGKSINESLENLLETKTNLSYYKAKSDFVTTPIPTAGWTMIREIFHQEWKPMMILDAFGGRMSQICERKIPFPHRKGTLYNIQYLVNWNGSIGEDNENNKHIEWMRRLHQKMEPYVSKSPRTAYLNYRDLDLGVNGEGYGYEEARSWGESYFKDNFLRLAKVKSKVDPDNYFRYEQSIPPFR